MNCLICNTNIIYESLCDPYDINLDINGDVTIFTCPNCSELFNLIHNHDTDEIKLEIYK